MSLGRRVAHPHDDGRKHAISSRVFSLVQEAIGDPQSVFLACSTRNVGDAGRQGDVIHDTVGAKVPRYRKPRSLHDLHGVRRGHIR